MYAEEKHHNRTQPRVLFDRWFFCAEIKYMPYKDREKQLKYLKMWRKENREYHLKKWREFIEKNPGYTRKYHEKWVKSNKEKSAAHMKVYMALKKGTLKKRKCFCGKKAEAHHSDYSKPLDVEWLCRKHHKETHKKIIDNSLKAPIC